VLPEATRPVEAAPAEVQEPIVLTPSAEVVTTETPTPTLTPGDGEPVVPAAGVAKSEATDEDTVAQVEKILRTPRWEKKEDPFKGFNSPPGRF
jgi:hypothetical protein